MSEETTVTPVEENILERLHRIETKLDAIVHLANMLEQAAMSSPLGKAMAARMTGNGDGK